MKNLRIGIILMLIGVGIPATLYFFKGDDGRLFSITVIKKDKLTKAEIDILNSILDLQEIIKTTEDKSAKGPANNPELMSSLRPYLEFANEILKKSKELERIIGPIDKTGFIPAPPLVYNERISAGIPFSYSVGIGMLFFLSGFGIVVLSLMGRKGRTQ